MISGRWWYSAPGAVHFDTGDGEIEHSTAFYPINQSYGTLPSATCRGQYFQGWYYSNGTQVKVLSLGNTWYEVLVGSQRGYMMAQYIYLTGQSGTEVIRLTARLVNPNGGSVVNFRADPSLYAKVLGSYSVGTRVTVVEPGVDWTRVNIGNRTGYVSSYFLEYGP